MNKKPTNWTAISAIGQLLSGVAVALTLLYLTMQIRHAEIAASDANRLARAQGVVNFWLEAAHDPTFRKTALSANKPNQPWIEEIARRLELTSEEASQLQASTLYWFWLHWGQWNTSTEAKDLAELEHMVRRFYTRPPTRMIWEGHRGWLDPAFEAFVDELLAESDAAGAPEKAKIDVGALRRKLDALGIGQPSGEPADQQGK